MRGKPAELSAGLVAVKGAAIPSPDMTSRAGAPAFAPALTAAPAPTAQPVGTGAVPASAPEEANPPPRAAPEPEEKEANLAPLNFRISASFRREFKTYAAHHDLKLNELLRLCFEAYRRQQGD
jgi:hypothetical protein